MEEQAPDLRAAYGHGYVGLPLLAVYIITQSCLALLIAPERPDLKLVMEPYVLLFGIILHVQWRRVSRTFWENALPRPVWVTIADLLSFVVTFWALAVLLEAVWHEVKLL